MGTIKTFELIKNGSQIKLTPENADEYVNLYIDWKLNKSIKKPFEEFKNSFDKLMDTPIMKMFLPEELDELISGKQEYDWNALQLNGTVYEGYSSKSKTIKYFWQIFNELNEDQKIKMLYFITGTKNAPVGGLGNMAIKITKIENSERLPMAHTCFNQLDLPDYGNPQKLKEKLLICIENSDGFGFK